MPPPSPTVHALLYKGVRYLEAQGVSDPRPSAEVLLKELLGFEDRSHLYLHADALVPREVEEAYEELLFRRARGEPVAYLIGKKPFLDFTLRVGPGVFIPRPESELIVEVALALKETLPEGGVADLGSGSGALAIALWRSLHRPTVAVEKSPSALSYLRHNVAQLAPGVRIVQGDFLAPLAEGRYALVVSNPPYIPLKDRPLLMRELACEPEEALFSGETGLEAIGALALGIERVLVPQGVWICEMGAGQKEAVEALLSTQGFKPTFISDLAGIPRVFWVRKG